MKNSALKFINPVLALFFLTTMISMVLYKFGPSALRGSETLGEVHEFAGIIFFIIALIHLYYNWSWVRTNILGKKAKHKSK